MSAAKLESHIIRFVEAQNNDRIEGNDIFMGTPIIQNIRDGIHKLLLKRCSELNDTGCIKKLAHIVTVKPLDIPDSSCQRHLNSKFDSINIYSSNSINRCNEFNQPRN